METWTLKDILNEDFREALASQPDEITGRVRLQLQDGTLIVSKRQAFMNLFWWPVLTTFGIPIQVKHYVQYRPLTKGSMVKFLNAYYEEIMELDVHNAKRLKQALWDMLQRLYKFCCVDLLAHVSTIDIMDMADIMTDEPMAKILATKEKITPKLGTDVIEKIIDVHNKEIMDLIGTKGALKNDALYTYSVCGQLNKFQIPQTMYAFGVRTDVNDNIVSLPVIGSALDGVHDVQEYAVETLSAKKSMFYNNVAVSGSQYLGRKNHLLTSIIQHLYAGDCQSQHLIRFRVTEKNYEDVVGKLIYVDGHPVVLTKDNVGGFINQDIYMRSPMTCRYRKGVCEVCAGRVFANVNRKINIGILSAVHVIEPTTQKILSAKHLIKTQSLVYELPKQAAQVLYRSSTNEIRWKPDFANKLPKLKLGISQKDCPNIHDVVLLRADKQPKEERFSSITHIVLKDKEGKTATYSLEQDGKTPFFSADMLLFIRDHFNDLETDESMVWIPLEGTEKFPLFKTIVVNDNMLQFVSRVGGFLSDDIKNYTSCSEALQDLSTIIHDKVSVNVVHLEVLLKAYMVTSAYDYRVPRVTDPDNVMFDTTASILNNRSVGTKLAYQGLTQYMTMPSTYLAPKMSSPFDAMVGYL